MADRYWILGTGSWSSTNTVNWSDSSGGLGGFSVPTAADNVFFDANSNVGTTAFTVTMANSPRVCNDFTASGLDGVMTLAGGSIELTVSGSLTFQATNFTRTYSGATTFNATTTGKTITTNGVAFGANVFFNGVGGGWTLGSAFTAVATSGISIFNGTLNLQSYTLSTGRFDSTTSTTRTIAFGTGNITCTGTGSLWDTSTVTGLTTTGTQVVNVTSVGSTAITVSTGALSEANSISFNFTGGTYALTFLGTVSYSARNVDFTGYAGTLAATSTGIIYGNLKFSTGMTLTASASALTFGATSGTQQITSNTKTIDFPLTFNGVGGTFRLEDALTLGSTRTAALTNGTLNLQSFTLSTGLFSSSNSNTRTIAFGTGQISCTGTGTVWTTSTVTGLTTTGTQVVNVTSTATTPTTITVTTGALSESNSISFNFTGGTYALTFLGTANHTARNVNFTGYAGTWGATSAKVIYGNLTLASGMTLTASANALSFSATSGTQTITSNTKTLDFPVTKSGAGTLSCADALTLGSTRALTFSLGTLKLAAGTTSTVGSFVTSGTTLKYLQSTTLGTQATISDASGTNTATYLSIQDSAATGGATWTATAATNINAGNNSGWTLPAVVTATGNFLMFF